MKIKNNAILGLAAASLFSILYISGILSSTEDRLYDFFLRFRANRQRVENVVFLDVDDPAIAYNGVYPWPRAIPADGLLRLKEYGSSAAIFDIEYIDHGPQGVDSLYLNQGLGNDFFRSFSEIQSSAQDIFSAIRAGRSSRNDIDFFAGSFSTILNNERQNLYEKAKGVARNNDLYLAQAFALNGRAWSTINLQEFHLEGEQSERRPTAEERFSYPVNAADNAHRGAGFIDVLPALPAFSNAAKGAGFTNVEIDIDGVRRRVYLTQNIQDHWYLQLSFAPLIDFLGSPEILLGKKRLTIKQAKFSDGSTKDIEIPLDFKGRMLLDWPKEDYVDSYEHISFAQFSLLDDIEMEIELYCNALISADINFFSRFDPSLNRVPIMLGNLRELFDAVHELRNLAMEHTSDDYFDEYLKYRGRAHSLLDEMLLLDADKKILELVYELSAEHPASAEYIEDEAYYITQLLEFLRINLDRHAELTAKNDKILRDKFVIIGRVDTGTTDYGANPFYGKYINVGTHGVVLDTILSEKFIIPLGSWWRIIFMLIFIPGFFIISANFSPVKRTGAGLGATFLIFICAILLFRLTGVYWGPLGVVIAMIAAVITREIIEFAGSEKEKQFIRNAFSTYVSPDVVKEIITDPSRLQLGGTNRYMTAVFTDVKGFSTISEQLSPEELVSLLNRYLSVMSDIVLEEKGTIDKYIGDAIVAFYGAPLVLEDHALRACISAINMRKAEEELNKIIMEQKLSPMPILTRIGINTGYMIAGNMGTANKMNYTIMGNAVNLSARLEGVNKEYGTQILASSTTINETGDKLLYRKLDRVRVVGINEPVRLHEILDTIENASDEERKLVKVFHEALDSFENRDWKQAAEGFKEVLSVREEDAPSKLYLERSEKFVATPPKDNWDGVFNLTSK
ncbi:MAG: adenylate/guanylate cyclase domain-containing protein [Treponema sp.]|nr:adenylate/guanylate cyclase domain-containing protein [Treponema sp.]